MTRTISSGLLVAIELCSLALAFPTATTSATPPSTGDLVATVSPAPTFAPAKIDLRRRQEAGSYACGYNGYNSLTCNDNRLACQGTLLQNGQAYQYCSTSGASLQAIWTTMYAYGAVAVCPAYAYCCGYDAPDVVVVLFVAGGYTVTGFDCWTAPGTVYYTPYPNLMVPGKFSRALASLGPDQGPVSNLPDAVSSGHVSGGAGATTTPSNPVTSSSGSGNSGGSGNTKQNDLQKKGNTIALACGISIPLASLIVAICAWLCTRKR